MAAPEVLYRLARSDDPLRFSRIRPSDASDPKGGNRFDVPGGGVLYFATQPIGCFMETLARFRVSPVMRSKVGDDPPYMNPGSVPADWRERRCLMTASLPSALPFVDVEDTTTHTALSRELGPILAMRGIEDLDVGCIRGPDRIVTRAVSSWVHAATDEERAPMYSGVRYLSRLGDFECWAVFDANEIDCELPHSSIDRSDSSLLFAAQQLGITVH